MSNIPPRPDHVPASARYLGRRIVWLPHRHSAAGHVWLSEDGIWCYVTHSHVIRYWQDGGQGLVTLDPAAAQAQLTPEADSEFATVVAIRFQVISPQWGEGCEDYDRNHAAVGDA